MLADIKITYTNQADIKAEDSCVVVFAAPAQAANGPSAIAWQVIKSIARNNSYDFEYPSRTLVQGGALFSQMTTSHPQLLVRSPCLPLLRCAPIALCNWLLERYLPQSHRPASRCC